MVPPIFSEGTDHLKMGEQSDVTSLQFRHSSSPHSDPPPLTKQNARCVGPSVGSAL
jgi:hypothetical protein